MSPDMLNTCPDETLIRATGTYPGGGTFTDCWARPVPQYVSGAVDGADRLWEVLVFGSTAISALTTTACITSAELLYSAGYGEAVATQCDQMIAMQGYDPVRCERDTGHGGMHWSNAELTASTPTTTEGASS